MMNAPLLSPPPGPAAAPLLRRNSFLAKTLVLATLALLLVVALLSIGHRFLSEASERVERSLHQEIMPLVRLHRLQALVDELRILEVELPRLGDYFAVAAQLETMRLRIESLQQELLAADLPAEAPLDQAWQRYQQDLREAAAAAQVMDMQRVSRIGSQSSLVHYREIAQGLQALVQRTEAVAQQEVVTLQARQAERNQQFLGLAVLGVLLLLLGSLWVALRFAARLRVLRDAALVLAQESAEFSLDDHGNDELGELAQALVRMRMQLLQRASEQQLQQDVLARRVAERTHDLHQTNRELQRQIAESERLEQERQLLAQAIEQSPVGVVITDAASRIEYANAAFLASSGYSFEAIHGKTPDVLRSGLNAPEVYRELWTALHAGRQWSGEFINRRSDGSLFWEFERISPVLDADGRVSHYLAIREDITMRKAQEEKILHQAQYDQLTHLPNRMLARERLGRAVIKAERDNRRVALMFVDLDDFKKVNDTLGHEIGDALLIEAAIRLSGVVRNSDTVARLGGDEFLVIMEDVQQIVDSELLANKIIAAFASPFLLNGHHAVVTPSVGLAFYPEDASSIEALQRQADLAMYAAKAAGRNTWRRFDPSLDQHAQERVTLEQELRNAQPLGQLSLAYQPLVALPDRQLYGAEVLLRWQHPSLGAVSPEQFIPIAEQTGLIVEIGYWVMQTACQQLRRWRESGAPLFPLAINVSPRQFRDPEFLARVCDILAMAGLPASALHLEITEGVLMQDGEKALVLLQALSRLGVGIAMDDFGTGYSSLSYLKRFPFDTLKIDREFVRDIDADDNDRALVVAVIRMGHELGLRVVAEGVETSAQAQFLSSQHCDLLQGYYFSRPVPAANFAEAWLNTAHDVVI